MVLAATAFFGAINLSGRLSARLPLPLTHRIGRYSLAFGLACFTARRVWRDPVGKGLPLHMDARTATFVDIAGIRRTVLLEAVIVVAVAEFQRRLPLGRRCATVAMFSQLRVLDTPHEIDGHAARAHQATVRALMPNTRTSANFAAERIAAVAGINLSDCNLSDARGLRIRRLGCRGLPALSGEEVLSLVPSHPQVCGGRCPCCKNLMPTLRLYWPGDIVDCPRCHSLLRAEPARVEVAAVLVFLVLLATDATSTALRTIGLPTLSSYVFFTIALAASLLLPFYQKHSLRFTIYRFVGHHCVQCGYDLRGTPHRNTCPECGALREGRKGTGRDRGE